MTFSTLVCHPETQEPQCVSDEQSLTKIEFSVFSDCIQTQRVYIFWGEWGKHHIAEK